MKTPKVEYIAQTVLYLSILLVIMYSVFFMVIEIPKFKTMDSNLGKLVICDQDTTIIVKVDKPNKLYTLANGKIVKFEQTQQICP